MQDSSHCDAELSEPPQWSLHVPPPEPDDKRELYYTKTLLKIKRLKNTVKSVIF